MQTHKIEIRVHFSDKDKNAVMKDACIQAARQVLSVALLISDDRSRPEAKYITEDFIEGITVNDITLDNG